MRYKSPDAAKKDGVHYTPPALADFLVREALKFSDKTPRRVLDPGCGDGNLLRAVAEHVPNASALQLIGYEQDPEEGAKARELVNLFPSLEIRDADFLDSLAQVPTLLSETEEATPCYDLIIANPPYVRTQVLGAKAKELGKRFGLSGRVDLFHAFLAGMVECLADVGVLAVICPNRLLNTRAGATARGLVARSLEVCSVADFGDTALFSAAVLPMVLVARRTVRVGEHSGSFTSVYRERVKVPAGTALVEAASVPEAIADGVEGRIEVDGVVFAVARGKVEIDSTDHAAWTPLSEADAQWLHELNPGVGSRFHDVATIRVGIKTTADSVFTRDDWDELPEGVRPEPELLRPLLTHHEAQHWRALPTTRRVLYPHISVEGRNRTIDLEPYPRAAAYLELHRERLEAREYVIEAGRKWYEIWVPQDAAAWAEPKLVFPDISDRAKFFLDTSGAIVNGDCYFIPLGSVRGADPMQTLLLMLGVANSSVAARFYDAACGNRLYGGRRRFMTQYVEQFPLPELNSEHADNITRIASELADGVEVTDAVQAELERSVLAAFRLPPLGGESELQLAVRD